MNTNSELTERTATYYSKGKWRLWKQICKNIFHYYFWGGRGLILITFSLGKAREGTSAIASGQAKPVRPAPEQCTMPLLLTLAWLRSSVNTALPTLSFVMSSLLVHLPISTNLSEHSTGLCFLAAFSTAKCLSLFFPVWVWHLLSEERSAAVHAVLGVFPTLITTAEDFKPTVLCF